MLIEANFIKKSPKGLSMNIAMEIFTIIVSSFGEIGKSALLRMVL